MPPARPSSSLGGTPSPAGHSTRANIASRQRFAAGGYRSINLFFAAMTAYIESRRRKSTMAINSLRNKPLGPGGSTRRLHQGSAKQISASERLKSESGLIRGGGETGSTRV